MRLVAMTGLFLYSSFRQILHYFFQFTYLFKKIPDAILRQELRKLYQTAFPDDEQIPWADLMRYAGYRHHPNGQQGYNTIVRRFKDDASACLNRLPSWGIAKQFVLLGFLIPGDGTTNSIVSIDDSNLFHFTRHREMVAMVVVPPSHRLLRYSLRRQSAIYPVCRRRLARLPRCCLQAMQWDVPRERSACERRTG